MIDLPLRVNGDRRHRTVVDIKKGKIALTKIKTIRKLDSISYVEIYPQSGYIHQIRSHLSHIGHPIAGDELYNRLRVKTPDCFKIPLAEKGLFLHALSINIKLPGKKQAQFSAPLPSKFRNILNSND